MNTPAELISFYKFQYKRTTGREIDVVYVRGWFRLDGLSKGYRRAKFEQMLDILAGRPTVKGEMKSVNGVMTFVPADKHVVQSLMTGRDVIESRGTPHFASVSSETYWST